MAYALAYVKTNAARGLNAGHGCAVAGRVIKRARLGGSSLTRARRREPENAIPATRGGIALPIGLRRDDGGAVAVMAGEIGIGPIDHRLMMPALRLSLTVCRAAIWR